MEIITTRLWDTADWRLIKDDYTNRKMEERRSGVTGIVVDSIPGQGGELWLVRHTDTKNLSIYRFDEFTPTESKMLNENARQ